MRIWGKFTGWFDTDEKMLKTILKDSTKDELVEFLKENHGVEDPKISEYDDYNHDGRYSEDDFDDLLNE